MDDMSEVERAVRGAVPDRKMGISFPTTQALTSRRSAPERTDAT